MNAIRQRRHAARGSSRTGAAAVELAIVLLLLLTLIFGMIELSMAVFRYNNVSAAARRIARMAIVRGEMAPSALGNWGPTAVSGSGDSTDPVLAAIEPGLVVLEPADTTVSLAWPDGNSAVGSRVRVTITSSHDPFLTFPFTSGWSYSAVSELEIAH
ncbi:MAG: TadE/TadG family type IV pilus assembly protein [Planctomycetaceae bacterium]